MQILYRPLALLLCSLTLAAADRSSPMDALDRWVGGKWVSEGKFFDTQYSKTNTAHGATRCAWSPDHIFVVCDQDIVFGGQPMRDLSIYTYDPKSQKYFFYGISLGEEKARNTKLEITDNGEQWMYLSSDEIQGKTVQFRTTNRFHGRDAVEWWSEFSTDGGKEWTKSGEGKESRGK